jgi:hypothetical protein
MTDTIEGEVHEERALTIAPDQGMTATGAMALAALDDDEFDRRLAALEKGRDRVARIQRALMVKDVDYGVIPGTGTKPTLLKPGAEKLCQAYGLVANFTPRRSVGDGLAEPHLSYLTRCDLHLGSTDGPVVANGWGSANSWETKHRYRSSERLCPACEQPAIIKGKAEYGGGWVCFRKKGGCGAKYADGDAAIEGQSAAKVENPDPFDLDVVLAKMSEKRAYIDATLRATAASGLFTQDVEDLTLPPEAPPPPTEANGLIGTAIAQGTQDFGLRQSPEGWSLPFRIKEGRSSQIVVAEGAIAVALDAMRDDVLDKRVTVWGHYTDESFDKKKGDAKETVRYRVLHVTRIKGDEFDIPAPDAPEFPAEAPTAPLFDEAEQEAIFDAVDKAGVA